MRYIKLILVMAFVSGFLYSCVSCETGGPTPQHQVGQETQQANQQK
jgi:hypothetical protein